MPSVFEPGTVAEAAEAMRRAAAEGRSVSIERDGGDVVISTSRLTRLLEHEPGDLTCIVEAGMRLSELQERLGRQGQVLMLDPPGDPTIGACLAAGLSGPRRHRYGAVRDLVLGVTVVLVDGTVAHSGGRVVKNVAGYDLGKLFCGSRGRLGLIAAVALRLHPQPAAEGSLAVATADAEEAQRLVRNVVRSQLVPSALDLLWPGRLLLLFEGGERAVAAQLATAKAMLSGGEEDAGAWRELAGRQAAARGRVWFDPGRPAEFLAGTREAVVRVAAGNAYVPEPVERAWPPLAERVRAGLDPDGVLVA